jgi:hypothetical protein
MPPNALALLLITLLPIVPAYVLFRLLPSKAAVSGPFKGLKMNLSGAFAGYFLVFLTLIGIRGNFEGTAYQEWLVKGTVALSDSPAPPQYLDPRYVTFSVPSMRTPTSQNFSLNFIRTSDGQFDYPSMHIDYPGYAPRVFWLGPKNQSEGNEETAQSFDADKRVIDLGQITLVKLAAGQANPYSTQPQEAQR